MIDVDTYRVLQGFGYGAPIDAWLAEAVPEHHAMVTNIEVGDDNRVVVTYLDGSTMGDEMVTRTVVVPYDEAPTTVRTFGPGAEPPLPELVIEWAETRASAT